MTHDELKTLYTLLRRYQLEYMTVTGKSYESADYLLTKLFPQVYTQKQEQER